jgi:LemA protein
VSVAITLAILAALALGVLSAYRRLLGLRREVETVWRLADQRRTARHASAAQLIAALAGDQAGDSAAYAALVAARQRAVAASRMTEAGVAEIELGTAAARIRAVLDRPGVHSPAPEVMARVTELHAATLAFEEARKLYALTVTRHNAAIGMFPLSLVAQATGLVAAEGFD